MKGAEISLSTGGMVLREEGWYVTLSL
jgi:hypothetical protein